MGHLVSPLGFRLGCSVDWLSKTSIVFNDLNQIFTNFFFFRNIRLALERMLSRARSFKVLLGKIFFIFFKKKIFISFYCYDTYLFLDPKKFWKKSKFMLEKKLKIIRPFSFIRLFQKKAGVLAEQIKMLNFEFFFKFLLLSLLFYSIKTLIVITFFFFRATFYNQFLLKNFTNQEFFFSTEMLSKNAFIVFKIFEFIHENQKIDFFITLLNETETEPETEPETESEYPFPFLKIKKKFNFRKAFRKKKYSFATVFKPKFFFKFNTFKISKNRLFRTFSYNFDQEASLSNFTFLFKKLHTEIFPFFVFSNICTKFLSLCFFSAKLKVISSQLNFWVSRFFSLQNFDKLFSVFYLSAIASNNFYFKKFNSYSKIKLLAEKKIYGFFKYQISFYNYKLFQFLHDSNNYKSSFDFFFFSFDLKFLYYFFFNIKWNLHLFSFIFIFMKKLAVLFLLDKHSFYFKLFLKRSLFTFFHIKFKNRLHHYYYFQFLLKYNFFSFFFKKNLNKFLIPCFSLLVQNTKFNNYFFSNFFLLQNKKNLLFSFSKWFFFFSKIQYLFKFLICFLKIKAVFFYKKFLFSFFLEFFLLNLNNFFFKFIIYDKSVSQKGISFVERLSFRQLSFINDFIYLMFSLQKSFLLSYVTLVYEYLSTFFFCFKFYFLNFCQLFFWRFCLFFFEFYFFFFCFQVFKKFSWYRYFNTLFFNKIFNLFFFPIKFLVVEVGGEFTASMFVQFLKFYTKKRVDPRRILNAIDKGLLITEFLLGYSVKMFGRFARRGRARKYKSLSGIFPLSSISNTIEHSLLFFPLKFGVGSFHVCFFFHKSTSFFFNRLNFKHALIRKFYYGTN